MHVYIRILRYKLVCRAFTDLLHFTLWQHPNVTSASTVSRDEHSSSGENVEASKDICLVAYCCHFAAARGSNDQTTAEGTGLN